ncbi:gamma-glutamylcyclotransferase [candidate division KSB1 bacterium]|nr:gamma-glutamylcyclotransferase [candidate division KSB1 bacterium]
MAQSSAEISEDTNLLFVYGSLMQGMERAGFMSNPYKAVFVSTGVAHGTLYDFGAFPVMKESNNGSLVHGEVYELFDPQTFFDTLDLIEGYWPAQPERSLYVRKLIMVTTPEGEKSAWAYVLNQQFADLRKIPSGDFRQYTPASENSELE